MTRDVLSDHDRGEVCQRTGDERHDRRVHHMRRMIEGVRISRRIGRDAAFTKVVDMEMTPGSLNCWFIDAN